MDIPAQNGFGRWMKQRRHALDLTQEELGDLVGCSVVTVQRIEAGVRKPSKQLAYRLAQYLQVAAADHEQFVRFARGLALALPLPALNTHQSNPLSASVSDSAPPLPHVCIGRTAELEAIRRVLGMPATRLVTLVGPPGVGKTCLAQEVSHAAAQIGFESVFFVALSALSAPDMVALHLARVVGAAPYSTRPVLERILQALQGRRVLLIFDTCEHLNLTEFVDQLVAMLPALIILATSRVALQLPYEHVLTIPPLATPDAQNLPALYQLVQFPSVMLFLERVRAIQPAFVIELSNAQAVGQICARLAGIPLAIELAAARMRVIDIQALASLLGKPLATMHVLRRHTVDSAGLHHTMRAAIAWSYALLPPHTQQIFQYTGVLVNDWDRALLTALVPDTQTDPVDDLALLVEQHLVQPGYTSQPAPRFSMLDPIREYALEQLAATGFESDVRWRYAQHILKFVELAEPQLTGSQQNSWRERVDQEHQHVRAALTWVITTRQTDLALRFCAALWRFWSVRGYQSEGHRWCSATLELAETGAGYDMLRYAAVLHGTGSLAYDQGDFDAATELVKAALHIVQQHDQPQKISQALCSLGLIAWKQGAYAQAQSHFEAALAIVERLGLRQDQSYMLNNLGLVLERLGDYSAARSCHQRSLAIKREMNDTEGIASSLNNLGLVARACGDLEEAQAAYEQGLELVRSIMHPTGIAIFLNNLGSLLRRKGQYTQAEALLRESLDLRQELGDQRGMVSTLNNLARTALNQNDLAAADQYGYQAASIALVINSPAVLAEVLDTIAAIRIAQKQFFTGVQVYAVSEALRISLGEAMPAVDQLEQAHYLAMARQALGEQGWAEALEHGRLLDPSAAIRLATHSPPRPDGPYSAHDSAVSARLASTSYQSHSE